MNYEMLLVTNSLMVPNRKFCFDAAQHENLVLSVSDGVAYYVKKFLSVFVLVYWKEHVRRKWQQLRRGTSIVQV